VAINRIRTHSHPTRDAHLNRGSGGACYPTPSEGLGAWKNATETQQSAHASKSNMEEVVPKMARRRGSGARQSKRSWVRSCWGCSQARKNNSSVLSCIGNGIEVAANLQRSKSLCFSAT